MDLKDFGFSPGAEPIKKNKKPQTTQAGRGRRYIQRRLGIDRLINTPAVTSVNELIPALRAKVTPPDIVLGNLLLHSHATEKGKVVMKMFRAQKRVDNDADVYTNYETLQRTLVPLPSPPNPAETPDPRTSIAIPDSLIGRQEGDPTTHVVRFLGCNIGKQTPFLEKWAGAFGGNVKVSAPIHFHGLVEISQSLDSPYGSWEHMSYEFIVRSPKYLDHDDLVDAFIAQGYKFIGKTKSAAPATTVPPDNWKAWIPDLGKGKVITETSSTPRRFKYRISADTRTTLELTQQLRVDPPKISTFTWEIPQPFVVPPASDPQRQQTLEARLKESLLVDGRRPFLDGPSRFSDTEHRFPIPQRLGYKDIDDFIAGHIWHFDKPRGKGAKQVLPARGTRAVYSLVVPVTDPDPGPDPSTSTLIANFFPNTVTAANPTVINIEDDDERFFATVTI